MTHQAKRPYTGSQPHITSYFPSSTQDQYTITASPTTYTSNIPLLPPNVQSNLLQVGMRIRKSVPEGYKTGSPYSGFSLFSDSTSPSQNQMAPSVQSQEKPRPKTRPRAGARELTPFCGLLKVGGISQQQWGIYTPSHNNGRDPYAAEEGFADGEDGEMEDEGGLPWLSSQGSTISSSSDVVRTPSGGNKRRFFEDEETDAGNSGQIQGTALEERVLAVPRRRKWAGKVVAGGQENVGIVGEDVDFEEAGFLDYGLAEEVEMGGC
jgi:hypothetical protein